eukprot:871774-Amphidinium_carterae.1
MAFTAVDSELANEDRVWHFVAVGTSSTMRMQRWMSLAPWEVKAYNIQAIQELRVHTQKHAKVDEPSTLGSKKVQHPSDSGAQGTHPKTFGTAYAGEFLQFDSFKRQELFASKSVHDDIRIIAATETLNHMACSAVRPKPLPATQT